MITKEGITAEERVKNALIEELGEISASMITPDAKLKDTLGLDSLDRVLIADILDISVKEIGSAETVQDLITIVQQKNQKL